MTCKLKEQIAVNNAHRVFNVAIKINLLLQFILYKTWLFGPNIIICIPSVEVHLLGYKFDCHHRDSKQ